MSGFNAVSILDMKLAVVAKNLSETSSYMCKMLTALKSDIPT
jgi:hypothetical protein